MDQVKTNKKRIGKYVSLLLRHHPEKAGLTIDEHGWADVAELIEKVHPQYSLTEELLHELAYGPDKQRYEFSEDGKRVRALHGHSIKVDLGYEAVEPPAILYHGTAEKYRESIEKEGLSKKSRQYVHLSDSIQRAAEVGRRHGKLIIYSIDSAAMHKEGFDFFHSASGVWLTDAVPIKYMKEISL